MFVKMNVDRYISIARNVFLGPSLHSNLSYHEYDNDQSGNEKVQGG